MAKTRNLIIVSVMLVIGLGGGALKFTTDIQFSGMALATIFGILLNVILPKEKEEKIIQSSLFSCKRLLNHFTLLIFLFKVKYAQMR